MPENDPSRGHYLGTEVDERWWRLYAGVLEAKIGRWHAGRWADGAPAG